MEQLREVAMAYYARSTAEEKQLAQQFFTSLDVDGDSWVSLAEFKSVVNSWLSDDRVFNELDRNGDGTLDFEEVLTLYYMHKARIRKCDGCGGLLLGSYFSCCLCEADGPYDLCCSCYGGGRFLHHHSTENFLDDRSMRILLHHFMKQSDENVERSSSRPTESQRIASSVGNSTTRRVSKGELAFQAFDTGVAVGNAIITVGNIAVVAGCCIM